MTDKYAVIGNPIAHSKSPLIHAAFAKQTLQDLSYERVLAPLDGFSDTVLTLQSQGFKGLNITVPFKLEAFQLATKLTARAQHAGAVNTLLLDGVDILGDNTDGAGIVRDIEHNLQQSFNNQRVLLLGAGGAAEGVLHPILASHPAALVIANRSLDKAQNMAKKAAGQAVTATTFEGLLGSEFDIIINATSAGLTDSGLAIPASIFAQDCLAYDMMYGKETPFMAQARSQGARVADGLGMLVEQAAEAFYLWRGVRPETQSLMHMMRSL